MGFYGVCSIALLNHQTINMMLNDCVTFREKHMGKPSDGESANGRLGFEHMEAWGSYPKMMGVQGVLGGCMFLGKE